MELDRQLVALVTGGASGLGGGVVRHLAQTGASVVIADVDVDRGEALADELGANAVFVRADVTSMDDVKAALAVGAGMGCVRVAVSCAGIAWAGRILDRQGQPHDLELFRRVVEVNLVGTFNVLRLAAAAMARHEPCVSGERGVIVNTASIAAFEGQIGQVAYAASKAGVVGLTTPAARDLSAVGIRVNTIAPGAFDTPMLAPLSPAAKEALAAGVVFPKRLGMASEYAALVEHVIKNPYLNGETIRLDGALRMAPR